MEFAPKRLKIAFVIDSFDGIKTGGVFSAHRFINSLSKDHEITLVTTGKEGPDRIIMRGFYPPFFKGLMEKMGFIFAWPDVQKLQDLFAKVDLVHVQFPWLLGIKSIRIAREMGVPVVTGFHLQPENILLNIKMRSKYLSEKIYKLFIDSYFNKSDGVICPSDFALKELKSRGLKAKAVVVSNGLTPDFKPVPVERDGKYQGKFLILVVGRLAREKRVDLLIKAIERSRYNKRIQLVATGKGPMKERWTEMAKKLYNPAEFLFVSHQELITLYNSADLYVHTSEVELEGMAVLEAIGTGLPALISINNTSASSQFALNENFKFFNDDYLELARKIDFLIEHPEILSDARKRYREIALKYRMEDSVKLTEDFYFSTIKSVAKRKFIKDISLPQVLET